MAVYGYVRVSPQRAPPENMFIEKQYLCLYWSFVRLKESPRPSAIIRALYTMSPRKGYHQSKLTAETPKLSNKQLAFFVWARYNLVETCDENVLNFDYGGPCD